MHSIGIVPTLHEKSAMPMDKDMRSRGCVPMFLILKYSETMVIQHSSPTPFNPFMTGKRTLTGTLKNTSNEKNGTGWV